MIPLSLRAIRVPSISRAPVFDCSSVVGFSAVDLRFTHAAGIWATWTDVVVVLSELSAEWSLCLWYVLLCCGLMLGIVRFVSEFD